MSNFLKPMMRMLWTAIGGALPTAVRDHRGLFAIKQADSTEDELYIGMLDASGVMQFRRLVTTTLGDSTYVNVSGDTMTGALTITKTSATALRVQNDGGTDYFDVSTSVGLGRVYVVNGVDVLGYSDNYSTQKWGIVGSTGEFQIGGPLNHDGATVGFFGVTPATRPTTYSVTNLVTDRSYDANATTTAELADVLGTLIADLRTMGLVT